MFGLLNVAGYVPSAADLALSDAMQRYRVGFAATGDPNGATPSTPRSEAVGARAIRDGSKWGPARPATTSRGALAEPRAVPATG